MPSNPVYQSGQVTPTHIPVWVTDGVIQDSGYDIANLIPNPANASLTANVLQYGAIPDTQKAHTNVTMLVGSDILTVSDPIFGPNDVGKCINIGLSQSQGFSPWWDPSFDENSLGKIIEYLSPTSVQLNVVGSTTPTGMGVYFQPQSWPYANTPSIIEWGTDNGPAFQAALAANDSVFVPGGGVFGIRTQVIVKSGNTLWSTKGSGTIANLGAFGNNAVSTSGTTNIVPMFINTAYNKYLINYFGAGSTTILGYNNVPNLQQTIGDANISFIGLTFDMSCVNVGSGTCTVRLFLVSGGAIADNYFFADTYFSQFEGPNQLGCSEVHVLRNSYLNSGAAFNPWCGFYNTIVAFNYINMPPQLLQPYIYSGGILAALWMNSVGTTLGTFTSGTGQPIGDDQNSDNIQLLYNTVVLNGSSSIAAPTVGIGFFPDGASSSFTNCKVIGNTVHSYGNYNQPLTFYGGQRKLYH